MFTDKKPHAIVLNTSYTKSHLKLVTVCQSNLMVGRSVHRIRVGLALRSRGWLVPY